MKSDLVPESVSSPSDSSEEITLERARASLAARLYTQAEEEFLSLLERQPSSTACLDGLSQALMGRGAWREAGGVAELIAEVARPLDAGASANAWDRAAQCYFKAESHRDWSRAHHAGLTVAPPTVTRLVTFARRLSHVGQQGEALRLLRRAERALRDEYDVRLEVAVREALAEVHLEMGSRGSAIQSLSTIAALEPKHPRALNKLNQLLNQRVPTWHFPMMNDDPRNRAFEDAIKARLEPGDTVLDIGCGAGLLSLMAARAGADQIFAVEGEESVADVAEQIFAHNGYADQISLSRGRSTTLVVGRDLPQRADLLVSEIFDVSLLGEDALHTIKHAREHLLRPGAKVIPAQARVWCALVESDQLRARFHVDTSCGFDLSAFNRLRDPRVLQLDLGRFDYTLITDPLLAMTFDFEGDPSDPEMSLSGDQISTMVARASGRADGFIFWYDLVLAPATEDREEITLSTSPNQEGTHWLQGFAPCYEERAPIEEGETLSLLCAYRRFLLWFQLY